jgi:ATP-binding cassette subfamily B protein
VRKSIAQREEWQFFTELPRASMVLSTAWWALIALRGLMPALFTVCSGWLVGAVIGGRAVTVPVLYLGLVFVLLQVLPQFSVQVAANLGDRLTARLNAVLLEATTSPAGIAHLESPELTDDLTLARDYELGLSGPPMSVAIGFIGGGLVDLLAGAIQACLLFSYAWWAPLTIVFAWGCTHLLLRQFTSFDHAEGEVLQAQRTAEYAYRLAMDTPAAKEVRLFGLGDWITHRFGDSRRALLAARWDKARLRRGHVCGAVVLVVAANAGVFWALGRDAAVGKIGLAACVVFAQAAVGANLLAFGGLNWALPHVAHAVAAVRRLTPRMETLGALPTGTQPAEAMPRDSIRFRDVAFRYGPDSRPILDGFNLTIPAGRTLAVVGLNGAGKTTLMKLLCRFYDPSSGSIEIDGVDLRELDLDSWRARISSAFQDFIHYDLTLRENVSPHGATDNAINVALEDAGAGGIASLDTVLSAGYDGGIDLSGGQWQRVALARVLNAVRAGAGLVILDEPTAQLDIRGEAEIFARLLAATRGCTTILISHRFATVRQADLICVLEEGRVVELGTHEELMALSGRYQHMFEVQASRFADQEPSAADKEPDDYLCA